MRSPRWNPLALAVGIAAAVVAISAPVPARGSEFDATALDQVATAGGTAADTARSVAVDATGNRFVLGTAAATATFSSATLAASMTPVDASSLQVSAATSSMFLAKYSATGSLQWVASATSTSGVEGYDVAVDPAGMVVVTGRFLGVAEFTSARDATTGGALHAATVTASSKSPASSTWPGSGFRDMFIARYSTAGAVDWVATAGNGTLYNEANGVAVDGAGNVFVTGHVWSDSAPNPKTVFRSATSSATSQLVDTHALEFNMIAWLDMFLAKYGPDGALQWVVFAGSSWEDRSFAVAVGGDGHPVITGSYAINSNLVSARRASDGALVSTSALTLGATDWYECYVAKYHTDGTLLWANRIGAAGTDSCSEVRLGPHDRVLVAGIFTNSHTVTSGRAALTGLAVSTATVAVTSRGGTDVFVGSFTRDGALEWVATGGTSGNDEVWSLATASTSGFAISARANTTPIFTSATLAATGLPVDAVVLSGNQTPANSSVIARFSDDGRLTGLSTVHATTDVSLVALAIDGDDRLHAVGSFSGELTLTSGDTTVSATSSGTDAVMVSWGRRNDSTPTVDPPGAITPPRPLSLRTERVTTDMSSSTVALSQHFFSPGVPVVYLATGTHGIDAVTAGRLAGLDRGPVLTVGPDGADAPTLLELDRLRPGRLVVIGGDEVMSPATVAQVQAATGMTPQRIAGFDRYETAARLSSIVHPDTVDVAYVATGRIMTEAITGAPAASLQQAALLLVEPDRIPDVTATELRRLRPDRIIVLGQTEAVSVLVERDLLQFAPVVERIGGLDRYQTAVELSRQRFPRGAGIAFLTPGDRPQEALGAVPIAVMNGGPVLFTYRHCVPDSVLTELDRLNPVDIQILGSSESVSDAVARLERCAREESRRR